MNQRLEKNNNLLGITVNQHIQQTQREFPNATGEFTFL